MVPASGASKQMSWANTILEFIADYGLENVVTNPEEEDLAKPES